MFIVIIQTFNIGKEMVAPVLNEGCYQEVELAQLKKE